MDRTDRLIVVAYFYERMSVKEISIISKISENEVEERLSKFKSQFSDSDYFKLFENERKS